MATDNAIVVAAGVAMQTMDKDKLTLATAIALAESGGNENATNRNTNGTIDVGVWQINSVHRRNNPDWSPEWLKNLDNNAKAMAKVSGNGNNWQPWSAYNNGRYKQFMDRARAAVDGTPTNSWGASDVIPGVGGALDLANVVASIADPIIKASIWLGDPANWIRIIQVGGGIAIGLAAISIFLRPVVEETGGKAAKAFATKGLG